MSRKITAKISVKGTLKAATPLSVGGSGVGEHVDIELATDGAGKCYIPGTSLAGAIRSWLERHGCKNHFFGETDGEASRVYVNDAPIYGAIKERRHGISINDDTGTVSGREGFLYTRAILPRGTSVPFSLELDAISENDGSVMALVVKALEAGEIRFGGCRARGMGRMYLTGTEINFYDFANDDTALDLWLENSPSAINSLDSFIMPKLNDEKSFHVKINWKPEANLMVKSGLDGISTKIMPLVSGVGEGLAPVISGTSLKGIFRAHARKILSTVLEDGASKILDDIFGDKDRVGRLMIDDVYCNNQPVPFEDWITEDAAALDRITSENQHVAIDRFTGGASQGALYNARPVKSSCAWEPIIITLDSYPEIPEETLKQELALLKLLVRDFSEGYISVGFGSRRGLGRISRDIEAEYMNFPPDDELQESWNKFLRGGFIG